MKRRSGLPGVCGVLCRLGLGMYSVHMDGHRTPGGERRKWKIGALRGVLFFFRFQIRGDSVQGAVAHPCVKTGLRSEGGNREFAKIWKRGFCELGVPARGGVPGVRRACVGWSLVSVLEISRGSAGLGVASDVGSGGAGGVWGADKIFYLGWWGLESDVGE